MRQISLCSGHGICDSTMVGGINNIPSNEVSHHGLEYGSHISKLFNNVDSARPEYRYFSFEFYINRISYYLGNNVSYKNTFYISGACVKMVGVENTATSKKRSSVKMASTMITVSQLLMKLLVISEVNYTFFDRYIKIISQPIKLSYLTALNKYKGRIGIHDRFIVASTYPFDNYTTVYCRKN